MDNLMLPSCPPPFLDLAQFPTTGGYIAGRFCGPLSETLTCCLPCPLKDWVYSDSFDHKERISEWFNAPALVVQVFLLVTFAVLGKEKGQAHYLSFGLCVSLIMLELSFLVPLGTKPEKCYNDVTPRDMNSSLSCAWSGALIEFGSMAGCVWILLRSLWTNLRVCWDVHHRPAYMWTAHVLGWGLPALFLAISIPVTGVSYRLGATCLPNPHGAFVTWFGWLIAFASLAALIQFGTTTFCLAVYMRSFFIYSAPNSNGTDSSSRSHIPITTALDPPVESEQLGKRFAWRRVRKVMLMQWRSVLLSILVTVEIIYFGVVYVEQTRAEEQSQSPDRMAKIQAWSACIVLTGGDKNQCLHLAKPLRLAEGAVVGSLFMSALIGLFTFGLMVRRSMIEGWWELICKFRIPGRKQTQQEEDFVVLSPNRPQRLSLGDQLRGFSARGNEKQNGVLPSPDKSDRQASVPEAGDVTERHETTNLFDDADGGEDEKRAKRVQRDDVV